MEEILARLNNIPSVSGVILVGEDGMIIAKALKEELNSEVIGASVARVYSTILGAVEELKWDSVNAFLIEGTELKFLVKSLPPLIVVIMKDLSQLGLIRLEIEDMAVLLKQ